MVSYTFTKDETHMTSEDIDAKLRTTFKLSTQEASILGLLLATDVVSSDLICERLNVATEVRVAIHRLRKTLATHQVEIESKRHLGYWLTPEMKDRIRRRL
jgi:DNA-binding response OmpR family regulator